MAVTQTQAPVELAAATQASVELADASRAAVVDPKPPVGPADVIPPVQVLAVPADAVLPNGPVEHKAVALPAQVPRAVITLDLVAAAEVQH